MADANHHGDVVIVRVSRETGLAEGVGLANAAVRRLAQEVLARACGGASMAMQRPLAVDILLAGDAALEALNRDHLRLPGPTNVLAFPAEEGLFPGVTAEDFPDVAEAFAQDDIDLDVAVSPEGADLDEYVAALADWGFEGDADACADPVDQPAADSSKPPDGPDAPNAGPSARYLGEVVVSLHAARREAALYGEGAAGFEHAFARLLCHGLLHLAGFEHGPAMDEHAEAVLAESSALR